MERKNIAWILVGVLLVLGGLGLGAQAAGGDNGPGVLVTGVEKGSPAEKAGIARGDIVLAVDGKDVAAPNELMNAVAAKKAGDSVTLKVRHGDVEKSLPVTVGDRDGRAYLGIVMQPAAVPFAGRGNQGNQPWLFQVPRNPGQTPMNPRQMPMVPGFQAPTGPGAAVANVVPGGPAEKAGLKAGDLIESVNGTKADNANPLSDLIGKQKPGDVVTLSVRSDGKEARDVKVTLDKNPQKDGAAWLGVEYSMVGPSAQRGMPFGNRTVPGLRGGVIVNEVQKGSPAEKAGMKVRDIIVKIEGVPVASPDDVVAAVTHHKPGETVSFTIYRFNENKETDLSAVLGENPGQKDTAWLGIGMGAYAGVEGRQPDGGSGATPPQPNMPRGNRGFQNNRQPSVPRGPAA
jgi:S1-C subfamily serine protease